MAADNQQNLDKSVVCLCWNWPKEVWPYQNPESALSSGHQ